jgi:hypothetical protein
MSPAKLDRSVHLARRLVIASLALLLLSLAPLAGATLTSEIEPNDQPADATPISAPGSFLSDELESAAVEVRGALMPGDVDRFRFGLHAGELLLVSVVESGAGESNDPILTLSDPNGTPLVRDDDGGPRFLSQLIVRAESSGDFSLAVTGFADEVFETDYHEQDFEYRLVIAVASDLPRLVESDPGAPLPGTNNTPATADRIPTGAVPEDASGAVVVRGRLEPGDVDHFDVPVAEGALLSVAVLEPESGEFHDPVLRLLDSSGREVADSDDDGRGFLSTVIKGVGPPDTWTISVLGFGDDFYDGSGHREDFTYELVISAPGLGGAVEQNRAPQVSIAPMPDVLPGSGGLAQLDATVTDDGPEENLSFRWCKVPSQTGEFTPPNDVTPPGTGPGPVVFADPFAADTEAVFDVAGDYHLTLSVDDGERRTAESVEVRVPPVAPDLPPPDPNKFLAAGVGQPTLKDRGAVDAYYAAVDPQNERTTLEDWAALNGLDLAALEGVEKSLLGPSLEGCCTVVPYFQASDLGYGRRMVMAINGPRVAFYVDNHINVSNARRDVEALNTVAMEYSPAPDGGPAFTKFFVFAENPFTGKRERVKYADLDGRGFKGIPAVCTACHGGTVPHLHQIVNGVYPAQGNVGATFLPFDLSAMEFDCEPGFQRADLEAGFRELNQGVLRANPTPETLELVHGWYGGPSLPSPTQNVDFVPAPWLPESELYLRVIRPSCRSCHVAKHTKLLRFDRFPEQAGEIRQEIFEKHMQPQAVITYNRFWLSTNPHQPALLAEALDRLEPPPGNTLTCSEVQVMKLACKSDGRPLVRVKFQDSSHAGETVTVTVNGEERILPIRGRKAEVTLPAMSGPITVELIDPAGCLAPKSIDCG